MEENKNIEEGINFFNFSMQEDQSTPVFKEGKKEWVLWGNDNLYGDLLVDLINTSTKHNSLIKKKVSMTAGSGFVETEANRAFLRNEHGVDNMDTIAFKNAYDLMVFGGFAFAATWDNGKRNVARKTYVDFSKIRVCKDLDDGSEIAKMQEDGVQFYWYSADWSNIRKAKNKPELIQGFSEKYKKDATQLIWDVEYRPGCDYYTLPDYIGAMSWLQLDKEIATFHLSSVRNGFTPSMVISFKDGVPTDEEIKKFKRQLNKEYGGAENGSRAFVTFTAAGKEAPEFIPINLNSSDERFLILEDQIQSNIITAHGASPIVAGVATNGKLGSSSEVLEAEMIFQRNVIDSKQNILLNAYNKVARVSGVQEDLELEKLTSIEEIKEEDTNADKIEENA